MTPGSSPVKSNTVVTGKRFKDIMVAASGNLVEYFDFYMYAAFSVYFAQTLMPSGDSDMIKQIQTWAVYALSFFVKPLGSWLFGAIGDKYGRRASLVFSIALMGVSSLLFACIPTFETAGYLAPALLLFVRMLQGLSAGGEFGMVATYLSEMSIKGRQGFYCSFQYVMMIGGQMLASMLALLMAITCDNEFLVHGGWRIPFVVGGLVALISLWVRLHLEESIEIKQTDKHKSGSMQVLLRDYWRQGLLLIGLTSAGSMMFYVLTVYSKPYMIGLGIPNETATMILSVSMLIFAVIQPLTGCVGDLIGTRKCMQLFAVLTAVSLFPIMVWGFPQFTENPIMLIILLSMMMVFLSFYTSISAIFKAALFPANVRGLGVSFYYSIANALFGGTATFFALMFKNAGMADLFFVYAIVLIVICFFCTLFMPRRRCDSKETV